MHNYISIQYLRIIAASMVVLVHMQTTALLPFGLFPAGAWTGGLYSGVDIFFVISGFIMMKSTENVEQSPAQFLKKRLIRIAPIYWAITFIFIAGLGFRGWHSIASFLFIPAWDEKTMLFEPSVPVGWTLNYEMYFYVIFAASLLLNPRYRIAAIASVLGIFVGAGMFVALPGIASFYSNPIVFEFVAGMMIARFRLTMPAWLLIPAFIALLYSYTLLDYRLLCRGVPAAMVVASALSCETRSPHIKLLKTLGDASYAIYLTHLIGLLLCSILWTAFLPISAYFLPFAFVGTLALGAWVHLYFERPVTAYLNRLFDGRRRMANLPLADARSLP